MVGHSVMTEHEILGTRPVTDSIGMGSYTLDSHNIQRYVTPEGYVQNEGDFGVHVPKPYSISYRSVLPKENECENLLVPVCLSSSHVAGYSRVGGYKIHQPFLVGLVLLNNLLPQTVRCTRVCIVHPYIVGAERTMVIRVCFQVRYRVELLKKLIPSCIEYPYQ